MSTHTPPAPVVAAPASLGPSDGVEEGSRTWGSPGGSSLPPPPPPRFGQPKGHATPAERVGHAPRRAALVHFSAHRGSSPAPRGPPASAHNAAGGEK
eukprot:1114035-Prymnesium_polylepis.1